MSWCRPSGIDRFLGRRQMLENPPLSLVPPEKTMSEAQETALPPMPDRLSVDPRSPYHVAAVFQREIGIRLNNQERRDVEEYCISEGWVKVPAGRAVDRKGRPLTIKLKGTVEAFYR
jgi:hypothetical protein